MDPITTTLPTRYRIDALLGEGGMGRVHRAWDQDLNRWVALKFIRGAEGQEDRILAEARLQARVTHEAIAQVYEVGSMEGHPFIAMQLIEGEPLDEVAPDLPLATKVALVRDVALAIHAAHLSGLVHRDLKPRNVLVARLPDGSLKPFIVDFGVARVIGGKGFSTAGLPPGTLMYMAPETVLGQGAADFRSDLYALGTIFFQLLTGRLPFEGAEASGSSPKGPFGNSKLDGLGLDPNLSLLYRILEEPPPRLRMLVPGLSRDLETIVLKCLEKDPADRYASALGLSEDLDRFLRGEPVLAKPVRPWVRAGKYLHRHRRAAWALGMAGGVALAAGIQTLRVFGRTRSGAGRVAELAAEGKSMERRMHEAFLLPSHPITQDRDRIRQRMNEISKRMTDEDPMVQGAGRYALGCGHLVLREFDAAQREFSAAWEAGYRNGDVSLGLGTALAGLYRRKRMEAVFALDAEACRKTLAELNRTLRDPAIALMKDHPPSQIEPRLLLEGRIALDQDDFEGAMAKAREALNLDPSLYEARVLEGEALIRKAEERMIAGRPEEAMPWMQKAGEPFEIAMQTGRSDSEICAIEAARCARFLHAEIEVGRFSAELCTHGLKCADEGLSIDPSLAQLHWAKARLIAMQNYLRAKSGPSSALDAYEAAMFEAEKAYALDAKDLIAFLTAAEVATVWGLARLEHWEDSRDLFQRGLRAGEGALNLAPRSPLASYYVGLQHYGIGLSQTRNGADPRVELGKAVEWFERCDALGMEAPAGKLRLALAWQELAKYEWTHGLDGAHSTEEATRRFEQALAEGPKVLPVREMAALGWATLGESMLAQGRDGQPCLNRAMRLVQTVESASAGSVRALIVRLKTQACRLRQSSGNAGRTRALMGEMQTLIHRADASPSKGRFDLQLAKAQGALAMAESEQQLGRSPLASRELALKVFESVLSKAQGCSEAKAGMARCQAMLSASSRS